MVNKPDLSKQTLKRLPIYMSYLKSIKNKIYISSSTVARELDMKNVQVRKDLAAVSKRSGIPRKGFVLTDLIEGIEDCLGYKNSTDAILVGAGKLGRALMDYGGFENYGIKIVAAFDRDLSALDNERIFNTDMLPEMCKKLKVQIGIITVSASSAQKVCDMLVENGIKAIWNFAPVHLKAPESILVQNENMASSLALLSNHLRKKLQG